MGENLHHNLLANENHGYRFPEPTGTRDLNSWLTFFHHLSHALYHLYFLSPDLAKNNFTISCSNSCGIVVPAIVFMGISIVI